MPERPNVVVVLVDEMRAEALENDQVHTPTLDRLADEGVRCTSAYTPHPVCSPARGSIQTGQYSHSHGVVGNKVRLSTEIPTLAGRLRAAGYHTGYVGMWHLDGEAAPGYVPPGPRRQGYEHWRGFNSGVSHHRGHPHVNADGTVEWEGGYQPAVQTDLAVEFVDDHRDEEPDRPFFLMLSLGPPHPPFDAPEEYSALYDPRELELRPNVPESEETDDLRADLAEYYALVSSVDDQLERLLDCLDERGVTGETLVVFTSDHGEMLGSQGRQRKGYPFEESIHVPMVWRYPDAFPAGEPTDALLNLVDIAPTVLSVCDVTVPDRMHGADRSRVLAGDAEGPEATFVEGLLPLDSEWRAVRTERYTLVVDRALEVRYLFDNEADPYQQENLAGDPEYADVRERLYGRLVEWLHDTDDSRFVATEHATRFRVVEEAEDRRATLLDFVGDVFDDAGNG
jgi:arylsulfatase A-like enzyme